MGVRIVQGDVRDVLPTLEAGSVHLCLTSPPYMALRSYLPADHPDKDKEIGSEPTPEAFVATMVGVFREVRRILRDDGCLVLNLGDSYAGSGKGPTGQNGIGDQGKRQGFTGYGGQHQVGRDLGTIPTQTSQKAPPGLKPKDLMMIPFRVAMALQQDGWYLRSVIPWVKRNPMPESVQDRPATSIEYLFLLSKSRTYFWDGEAIRVPQSGNAHSRGQGITPKSVERDYSDGDRVKANTSFHASTARYVEIPGGRAYRNSDAFFQSWQGLMCDEEGDPLALIVNPMPLREAHFASFPPKLVEPFVKAATSEDGCCPSCRAPWRRVVERTAMIVRPGPSRPGTQAASTASTQRTAITGTMLAPAAAETLGWELSCACPPADPTPCTVFDPFGGAGTTGLVADRLGRAAVLVELNPEYAAMARRRIDSDAPMVSEPVAVEVPIVDAPTLFDAMEKAAR